MVKKYLADFINQRGKNDRGFTNKKKATWFACDFSMFIVIAY
jgi:hypothetical protein